jgi:hypothetical protein
MVVEVEKKKFNEKKKFFFSRPLISPENIQARLDAVGEILENFPAFGKKILKKNIEIFSRKFFFRIKKFT